MEKNYQYLFFLFASKSNSNITFQQRHLFIIFHFHKQKTFCCYANYFEPFFEPIIRLANSLPVWKDLQAAGWRRPLGEPPSRSRMTSDLRESPRRIQSCWHKSTSTGGNGFTWSGRDSAPLTGAEEEEE